MGIDEQPYENANMYWGFFFVLIIILSNFFLLNLFAGVVVSTFNKEKEILDKNYLLSEHQKKWLQQKKEFLEMKPITVIDHSNAGPFRLFFIAINKNKKVEIFFLFCIIMNTIVLTINWYSQSVYVDDILDYVNYGFASTFALEALCKIIALTPYYYFKEAGNMFDFFTVVASIITSAISISLNVDFGASATFIRALRISKIFKFIRLSKQVEIMFNTMVETIGPLSTMGGLLVLFMYIYSVLGVFLFSEVMLQSNLSIYANFQSFGIAFLTLLRCSTGETWDSIMLDLTRGPSIVFQCDDSDFDYQKYVDNGYQTTGCGSAYAGLIYFISYIIVVPLIFLNLFIAIILEGFEEAS
jgi:Ion transport protein